MARESEFQSEVIGSLKARFPGCIVLKNDANYLQGFPDLTIFYGRHWATLECKRDRKAPHRPNQDYYVSLCDEMSFSSFIYPENKEEILDELQQAFRA